MRKKHSAANERIKREYFTYLREAKRYSTPTVDAVAKAVSRFEAYTGCRDFRAFHIQQAVGFKAHLLEQPGIASGKALSPSTVHATLGYLKAFFQWLAGQPGFKSRIGYADADYFNLPEKDARVATARSERAGPTLDQIKHVLAQMPTVGEIALRNRAIVAFTILTGVRDGVLASLKLKHVDVAKGRVNQDAREVKTKFSKTFVSYYFPVLPQAKAIVEEWTRYLVIERLWGPEDPLFPATKVALGATRQFEAIGLERTHWTNASSIRSIFKVAFEGAGLPYANPHSFRKTLAQVGEQRCRTPEQFKAWSQNLGHEGVLTTFYSYGSVSGGRQAELLQQLCVGDSKEDPNAPTELAKALVQELIAQGVGLRRQ